MKLTKSVFQYIINSCVTVPPKSGVILGGSNTVVIDVVFDRGIASNSGYYYPDTERLNTTIDFWNGELSSQEQHMDKSNFNDDSSS